jgi:hypothetical protein
MPKGKRDDWQRKFESVEDNEPPCEENGVNETFSSVLIYFPSVRNGYCRVWECLLAVLDVISHKSNASQLAIQFFSISQNKEEEEDLLIEIR